MPEFRVTRKALADLIAIGRYTEREWGIAKRNAYLKRLDDCFHSLAENPDLGSDCEYIAKDYRKFPQGSHLVFYKLDAQGGVDIIRVLHQSMDVESKF